MRRLILAVAALCLVFGVQQAVADDLFISEYVEGTSNSKALELYNPTSSDIDLDAGGYEFWMYFNGSTTATQFKDLTGTVASGGTFVYANPSSDPAILAVADQLDVGTIWYNGDDAVALVKTIPDTSFVDVIGQIGFDPGSEWGTGDTSTQDNTLRRKPDVCMGDPDGSDAFDPSIQWIGYPTNTFDGLGSHDTQCTPIRTERNSWGAIKSLYNN
jgi:predicted extracellular nuclease